jgi:RNA polymerase sigma-70 factor (ECF subfamily)
MLEQLRARDSAAWSEFLELRRPQLMVYIDRNLGEPLRRKVEATDLCQEVWLSALNGLEGMDFSDRDPFGWLCQLADRRIVDAHRRYFGAQKRAASREVGLHGGSAGGDGEPKGLIDLLVASMTTPSQVIARDQRAERLSQALARLPETAREAIRLRYIEGLPSKEIAAQIGKTDGATRVLLTRTLAKLQELLSDDTAFESFLHRPEE